MKKRKICIICSVEFTYEKFLKSFANNLSKKDYEVHVGFSFENNNKYENEKITFHNLPLKRKAPYREIPCIIYKLKNFITDNNFDIIHVHTPSAGIYTRVANFLSFKKNKLIYVVHGFYFHENMSKFKYLIHFSIEYFLSKLTNYIFFVSKEDLKLAKKFNFKSSNLLKYISNGVSEKRFFPLNKESKELLRIKYKIPLKSFSIGIVARLVKEKGYKELLKAFEKLIKIYPNLHLIIAGSYLPSDHNDAATKIINLFKDKYPSKLSLLGNINEIEEIYNIIDIFCLPSHREGLPYTLIEAMLSQLPIVTTNIRGCRELIDNKKDGLIVEPYKFIEVFNALKFYIENKELAKLYGENARKKALKYYTESKILKNHIKLINSI